MTNITEATTHVVLFFDSSKLFLTEQQYQGLLFAITEGRKQVAVNGSLYTTAHIAKVLSLDEFYQEYPAEKPSPVVDHFDKYKALVKRPMGLRSVQQLLKGIERAIAGFRHQGIEPLKAIALAEAVKKRIDSAGA